MTLKRFSDFKYTSEEQFCADFSNFPKNLARFHEGSIIFENFER